MINGSCLCGGVRFRLHAELAPIQICHCTQCRKAQGGPVATNTPVNATDFEWISGRELLRTFESTPGKRRHFCSICGSPIYSERDSLPGVLRIRAGLLDNPVHAPLEAHYYVESKADWWPISDDLPQHAGARTAPSAG